MQATGTGNSSMMWLYGGQAAIGAINSIGNGYASAYNMKASAYNQMAQAAASVIPQYQQIGAQTRQLQQQQAISYMNSGVDVSQGTASYVVQRTGEQGIMKMNEIQSNLNTYLSNTLNMAQINAKSAIFQGFTGAVTQVAQSGINYSLYNTQYGGGSFGGSSGSVTAGQMVAHGGMH